MPNYFTFTAATAMLLLTITNTAMQKNDNINYPPPLQTATPADCNINLRDSFLFDSTDIATADFFYGADSLDADNFFDVVYKIDENVGCVDTSLFTRRKCDDKDLHSNSPGGDRSALRYRVYYPKKTVHDYETTTLPVVFLSHGGGFTECSDYEDDEEGSLLAQMALLYARKGFICVLLQYRTGVIKDVSPNGFISTQQMFAVYRGAQDINGCIRSFIKRDAVNGHGNQSGSGGFRFKINKDQVFAGGLSAGSVATLAAAYYRTQTIANQVFLNKSNSDLNIEEALGNISNNYYYYGPDSPAYNVKLRGILNCWGGIVFPKDYDGAPEPYNEYQFFQGGGSLANPPQIGFQGKKDKVIWYTDEKQQDFRFSVDSIYKQEGFCLFQNGDFKIKSKKSEPDSVYVKQGSAYNMHYILKDLDRFAELYEDADMKHGLDTLSNFGFSVYNKDTIIQYIVQRSAVFFQTIMVYQNNGNPGSFPPYNYRGTAYFKDCKNSRICTDTTSNNSCP